MAISPVDRTCSRWTGKCLFHGAIHFLYSFVTFYYQRNFMRCLFLFTLVCSLCIGCSDSNEPRQIDTSQREVQSPEQQQAMLDAMDAEMVNE
ncbi:hypothetical protein SAMN06265222_104206 [Neorhodopirellula lusitana]|uniref:Secreted protein n=2 Tax=Neorhodopirellula lusitana TaxID=445327 RepID=A0ABY1Q0L4_9BACT|nr:hypothetical protein SAMN06265222_104206 [Neorhodopirellula lusitana]